MMKSSLNLLLLVIISSFFAANVQAQCSIGNPLIEITNTQTVGSNCQITFNFSYTADQNNGADRTFIHLWTSGNYPNPTCNYSSSPTTCLNNTIANIIIDNDAADQTNPVNADVFLNGYTPYPTINPKVFDETEGLTFQKVVLNSQYSRYKIYGITLTVPGACNSFITLKSDIWSTQANSNNPTVHCSDYNLDFLTLDPTISGNIQCTPSAGILTNTFDFTVTTSSTNTLYFDASVYYDNGNGLYDLYLDSPLITTITGLSTVSGSPYRSGTISYTAPDTTRKKQNLIVVLSNVHTATQTFESITANDLANPCAMMALPITLYQFTGNRNHNKVQLTWTTQSKGELYIYEVQKLVDNNWQAIGSVSDKNNGTINNYNFTDDNYNKDYTLYRIAMKGNLGDISYSNVLKIGGVDAKMNKQVKIYPNPTKANIKGNLQIETTADCNIIISDLQGRIINRIENVGVGTRSITLESSGIYFMKAINNNGTIIDHQKIVVY